MPKQILQLQWKEEGKRKGRSRKRWSEELDLNTWTMQIKTSRK